MSGMHFPGAVSDLGIESNELIVSANNPYGQPGLKSALSRRYGVPEKNILLNIGVTGVNYLLFAAMFNHGDEVLVETPVYDVLPGALRSQGITVVDLPRRWENGYQIDEDDVKKLLTDKTGAVLITNLHNPSGARIPARSLISLASLLEERGCLLIVDEIYLEFYFGKGAKTAFLLGDNIITTSGLTKAFGLGGLRAGWGFAPENIVKQGEKMFNVMTSMTPDITEYIAYRVVSDDGLFNSFAKEPIELMNANLSLVDEFIGSHSELSWIKPDGGVNCFPRTVSAEKTERLFRVLWDEYDTLIIPGRFFGDTAGFRLGYGIAAETLREGLENMGKALESL